MAKEMTVSELRLSLDEIDGNLPVKMNAGATIDADIVEVRENGEGEFRKPYVSLIAEDSDEYENNVLRAFFLHRLPIEAPGYTAWPFTSQDIIDMLEPMVDIGKAKLVKYLSNNGYEIRPQMDGVPRWILYTKMDGI